MLQIKWNDFEGTNINFTIKKNWQSVIYKIADNNAFIFPMLTYGLDYNDPSILDDAIGNAIA
jgi:hypothetical protein